MGRTSASGGRNIARDDDAVFLFSSGAGIDRKQTRQLNPAFLFLCRLFPCLNLGQRNKRQGNEERKQLYAKSFSRAHAELPSAAGKSGAPARHRGVGREGIVVGD